MQSILQKNPRTVIHLLRAAVSSGAAFGLEFCILFLLVELAGVHYFISTIIAFIIGTIFLYILSIHWIFHKRKITDSRLELPAFAGISALALLANSLLMLFFTEIAGIHYLLSRMTAALCVFAGNFILKKVLMF